MINEKPYAILINLQRPRITLHFKNRDDFVIDKKTAQHFSPVTEAINKFTSKGAALKKLVTVEIKGRESLINKSEHLDDKEKKNLIGILKSDEGYKKVETNIRNKEISFLRNREVNKFVDVVIVVTCEHDLSVRRAIDRGISEEEAENILKNQMSAAEKEKFADYVINNDNSLEVTKEGVEKIWQNLQKARENL